MKFFTHIGGFTMLSNSAGVFGTRRMIIFRPSVEPIPIDANERIEIASEYILLDPLLSLNMYELLRCNNVCSGCGDVADDVSVPGDVARLPLSSAIRDNWWPVHMTNRMNSFHWVFHTSEHMIRSHAKIFIDGTRRNTNMQNGLNVVVK